MIRQKCKMNRGGFTHVLYTLQNHVQFHIDGDRWRLIRYAFEFFEKDDEPNIGMAHEMKCFLELSSTRKCFIDVGSLFGIFSLAFTSHPDQVAHAVEPSRAAHSVLCRNVACNPERRIIPHRIFLSDSVGYIKTRMDWLHCIATSDDSGVISPTTTLDVLSADNFIRPDCLKIDTEGFEVRILEGGRKTIADSRPVIFLEAHHEMMQSYGDSIENLARILEELKYDVFTFHLSRIPDFMSFMSDRFRIGYLLSRIVCFPR